MKKTILLAAPMSIVLFYGSSQVTAQQGECESMTIPTCQDGTRITINSNSVITSYSIHYTKLYEQAVCNLSIEFETVPYL